jgi:hypothetical protein
VVFTGENQLLIFPNPIHNTLTIKNNFSNGTLYLYDISGNRVFSQKITTGNSGNRVSIKLPELAAGVYLVKLDADGQMLQGRIVKE